MARKAPSAIQVPDVNRIASAAIRKAMRHVEEHFTEKISSRDLAQSVGFSAEHFCRAFKEATGVCFTQYVASMRVAKACDALILSQQPISRIAITCGFQSLAPFNKTFRKIAGTSPTEYRAARKQ